MTDPADTFLRPRAVIAIRRAAARGAAVLWPGPERRPALLALLREAWPRGRSVRALVVPGGAPPPAGMLGPERPVEPIAHGGADLAAVCAAHAIDAVITIERPPSAGESVAWVEPLAGWDAAAVAALGREGQDPGGEEPDEALTGTVVARLRQLGYL